MLCAAYEAIASQRHRHYGAHGVFREMIVAKSDWVHFRTAANVSAFAITNKTTTNTFVNEY